MFPFAIIVFGILIITAGLTVTKDERQRYVAKIAGNYPVIDPAQVVFDVHEGRVWFDSDKLDNEIKPIHLPPEKS